MFHIDRVLPGVINITAVANAYNNYSQTDESRAKLEEKVNITVCIRTEGSEPDQV